MQSPENRKPSPPACPFCGAPGCRRDGRTPAGRQRWRCKICGQGFSEADPARMAAQVIARRLLDAGFLPGQIAPALAGYCSERWLYLERRRRKGLERQNPVGRNQRGFAE